MGDTVKNHAIAAIIALCLALPAWAADGNIGLYFDANLGSCQMNIPCHCLGRLYVYGRLEGASAGGITGAEYKIAVGPNSNADPGWLFSETFDPGATVIGAGALNAADPLGRGVDVAWPACQTGGGIGVAVLIETVEIFNLDCPSGDMRLQVVKHDAPSNPFFQCPLVVLCDAPVFTKVCVGSNLTVCRNPEPPFPNNATCSTSGEGWINREHPLCCTHCLPVFANCTIAVQSKAWSAVKSLYRD